MIHRYAVFCVTTGDVLREVLCQEFTILGFIGDNEDAIQIESPLSSPAYVAEGVVVMKPAQPSSDHLWDAERKVWYIPIESARNRAWLAVKAQRDAREFGPFEWGGHIFDGDEQSQRRLNLAVLGAQAALQAGSTWSMAWTLADNGVIELSAADLVAVVRALGFNIEAAHEAARAQRSVIEAATDVEDFAAFL